MDVDCGVVREKGLLKLDRRDSACGMGWYRQLW